MSIDKKTVEKVAGLARLSFPEEKKQVLADELNKIMGWIEQLSAVKTDGLEALTSVCDEKLKLREDVITDGGIVDKVLSNAPKRTENFFVVPKVVE